MYKFRQRSTRLRVGTQVYQIQWNNAISRPLCRSRSFKVTDIGTYRKPLYDFLLVINTNWHPISYRFGVITAYCSNFLDTLHFWASIGGLGTTYDVRLGLTGKHIMDFLLLLIELFSLGVMAEALRAKIDKNNLDFAPTQSLCPKISGRRGRPHQSFLRTVKFKTYRR